MVARVRSLGWLVASAWLTGCGPADEVDVTNTLEGVLPATESSKDFGDYVVYFNALNTDSSSRKSRANTRSCAARAAPC